MRLQACRADQGLGTAQSDRLQARRAARCWRCRQNPCKALTVLSAGCAQQGQGREGMVRRSWVARSKGEGPGGQSREPGEGWGQRQTSGSLVGPGLGEDSQGGDLRDRVQDRGGDLSPEHLCVELAQKSRACRAEAGPDGGRGQSRVGWMGSSRLGEQGTWVRPGTHGRGAAPGL